MTNVENTRSREVIPNPLLIVSKLDDMLVKKWKQGSFIFHIKSLEERSQKRTPSYIIKSKEKREAVTSWWP